MRAAFVQAWLALALLGACGAVAAQDKGGGFEDALITERVNAALGADPALRDMRISVATHEGVVHLTGFVNSMVQVERAAVLARRVEGVSAVRNTLRVSNRPSRA